MAKQTGKNALTLAEEAIHLLRSSSLKPLFFYYLGTLPFILGLLFFISDMSQNTYAQNHCAAAALLLALLFIWMKCGQALFALQIKAALLHTPPPALTMGDYLHLICLQTIIQPTGFFALPLALLITLPFGWVFAFYQNITVAAFNPDRRLMTSCTNALEQAKRWPAQNHYLLGIFSAFGFIVFLNLGVTIYVLPYILKRFVGIETLFTLSGVSVFNTTFFTVVIGITYLCLDPLIKTVYALRCFYGLSVTSGDDLKADLKAAWSHQTARALVTVILLFIFAVAIASPAEARSVAAASESHNPAPAERVITPEHLDQALASVLVQPAFTWRMARKNISAPRPMPKIISPFRKAFSWVKTQLKKLLKPIIDFIKKLLDTKTSPRHTPSEAPRTKWMTAIQALLFVLLCLTMCTLGVYLYRIWQNRRKGHILATPQVMPAAPDLSADEIDAGDFPGEKWLALAKDLISQGDFRLGLRALYLATLAHLAERKMITIARYKSNRDYEEELKRRAHENKEMLHLFSHNVRFFDKTWYGRYHVNHDDLQLFSANFDRIIACAG